MLNELDKYSYIDAPLVIPIETGDLTSFTDFTTSPITNLQVVPNISWNGVTNITKLQVTWEGNSIIGRSDTYQLFWYNENGVINSVKDLDSPSYDILNPIVGIYTITVIAVHGISNINTKAVKLVYDYKTNCVSSLLPPINPSVAGSDTLTVTSDVIKIAWEYNPDNDTIIDKLVYYLVEVYDEIPTTLINSYKVEALENLNGCFTITYAEIFAIFNDYPRKITFKVFSKDTYGHSCSLSLMFTIEKPVPAIQTFSLTAIPMAFKVAIDRTTSADILRYNIYTSTEPSGTRTLVYSGSEHLVTIPELNVPPALKYVTIDAYDLLGDTGLLTSPEQSVQALPPMGISMDTIATEDTIVVPLNCQLVIAEELFNVGEIINNNLVFII